MAESSNQRKRKKSKKFYGGGKKGKYENVIKAGMRGVLVFGADNEAKARREAYNLLNEYADELFGTEFTEHINSDSSKDDKETEKKEKKLVYYNSDGEEIIENENIESGSENEESTDDDIEKTIAKEIKQIKNLKKSRRFQGIPTGVNAILFIRTTLSDEDLNKLIRCILSDIAKTKQNKSRSFQRLIPITNICSADLKSIKTVTEHFLPGEDKNVSICVHYKSRFNNSLKRDDVVSEVSSIFLNSGHKVDLKNPDMVIVVEVMKGLCFMNMLNDFFHFKRYNLYQIANTKDKPESTPTDTTPTKDSATDNTKANVEGDYYNYYY